MSEPILDLAWPPRLVPAPGGGRMLATVEQDSDAQILQGLAIASRTRVGDLEWDETFGTTDAIGSTDPVAAAQIRAAELHALDGRPEQIRVTPTTDELGRVLRLVTSL